MSKTLPPFTVTHTPNIPEIIYDLGFTIVLSTYQVGKTIFLSATSRDKLIQLPRTFDTAMGVATCGSKLAVACRSDLVVLKNFPELAKNYPPKPGIYDSLFIPVCRYYTGALDLHDLNFIDNKLIAVNTLFSCLSEINDEFSFVPVWKPSFITGLMPEDRCHLNGVAVGKEGIEYATALGATDTKQGWRDTKLSGGVLIHVPSNEIILSNLSMPHSPRLYDGKLYFLNSAQGELRVCDPVAGTSEVITKLGGFARGMARYGDYLFIGMSKMRHTTDAFKNLPIFDTSFAGVSVVYLPYGKVVGQIKYSSSVDEIYDVKILPGLRRPGILNTEKIEKHFAVVTPSSAFWGVGEGSNQ